MAKYDWTQLEKEYILSDYKSVSAFLKNKGIKQSGSTKKSTKGWKNKKVQKEYQKSTKIIEKVTEKESEKEAQQIADLKAIANDLALNIIKANSQLEKRIAKNKKKTKTVKYDYKTLKPSKEEIIENEELEIVNGIIDRQGLKLLASALKDLNEILTEKRDTNQENLNRVEHLLNKIKEEANK